MPALDRRIIVRITTSARDPETGELVESQDDFPVWATVADSSSFDTESQGGTFTTALRKFVVRWRREFDQASTDSLVILDGVQIFNVTNLVRQRDGAERRRFMSLEGVAV